MPPSLSGFVRVFEVVLYDLSVFFRNLFAEIRNRAKEFLYGPAPTFRSLRTRFDRFVARVIAELPDAKASGRSVALLGALTFVAFGSLYAQTPGGPVDTTSPASILGSDEFIYGALVIVGGYLSAYIPGLNKIKPGVYRVLALAVAIGVVFIVFGFDASILSLILTYALSTSAYETVLKRVLPSPKAPDAIPATT